MPEHLFPVHLQEVPALLDLPLRHAWVVHRPRGIHPELLRLRTVAVQVDPWETGTEEGLQLTVVDVEREVTVNAKPVESELFAWTESVAV